MNDRLSLSGGLKRCFEGEKQREYSRDFVWETKPLNEEGEERGTNTNYHSSGRSTDDLFCFCFIVGILSDFLLEVKPPTSPRSTSKAISLI